MKNPAHFETSHLDVIDFDGTEFDTFETDPSRGIYGVDEAYSDAVDITFNGNPSINKQYADEGGHRNRTPTEIVKELVPDATPHKVEQLTNNLVRFKLNILENQIGKELSDGAIWPRPVPGFLEYSDAISNAKTEGYGITQAVLSAGHATFIRRCLDVNGVQQPEILITYETIAGLNSTLDPELLAKPNLTPLKLAVMQWKMIYGINESLEGTTTGLTDRITVIGDSDEKDGGLARNAGVRFIKISRGEELAGWRSALAVHDIGMIATFGHGVNIK